MPLRVICPGCQTEFELHDQLRGRKVRCKKCETAFAAEEPIHGTPAEALPPADAETQTAIQSERSSAPPLAVLATATGPARPESDENDDDDNHVLARPPRPSNLGPIILVGGVVVPVVIALICWLTWTIMMQPSRPNMAMMQAPPAFNNNPAFNNPVFNNPAQNHPAVQNPAWNPAFDPLKPALDPFNPQGLNPAANPFNPPGINLPIDPFNPPGLRQAVNAPNPALKPVPRDHLPRIVSSSNNTQGAISFDLPEPRPADWSAVRVIAATGNVPWNVEIEQQPPGKALSRQPIPLGCKGRDIERVIFSDPASAQTIVLSGVGDNKAGAVKQVRTERFDLTDGRSLGVLDLFKSSIQHRVNLHADLSPDAGTLATREPKYAQRIDVWSAADGKHIVGFTPYEKETEAGVCWFALLDGERLLTVNTAGKLVLWRLPECKAVYALDNMRGGLALSPGRKCLAYSTGPTYELLDTASGERKGQLAQPPGFNLAGAYAGAFRTDGAEFAAVARSAEGTTMLVRWETRKGMPVDSFGLSAAFTQVHWADAMHILLDTTLYDLAQKIPIWRYGLPGTGKHADGSPDGRHWYAASRAHDQPAVLTAQTLPDEPARRLEATLADAATQILFKPGTSISIRLDINGTPPKLEALRTQIASSMTVRLAELGHKVEASGAVLTIQTQQSNTGRTRTYQSLPGFGRPPIGGPIGGPFGRGLLTVQIKQLAATATLSDAHGAILWQHKATLETPDTIGIVHTDNPEAYFHEQLWTSFLTWATNVTLPSLIIKHGGNVETLPKESQLLGDR